MIGNIKLGNIAEVKGGKRLPKGFDVQDEETSHPYLRVTDFKEDGLEISDIKYITDNVFGKIKNYTISSNDIYISIAGTIGRIGIVPQAFDGANLTENAAKITNISSHFNKKYIMYFLRGNYGQAHIKSKTGGTSQPKLALYRIKEIEIPKIPIQIQNKIAEKVTTYDDLIENNRRRIRLLEESARLLYREWFVNLRFPGYEHVKIIDGVPEVWEKVPISSFCTVGRGGSPRPIKDYMDGSVPWFKIGDATASESPFVFSTKELLIEDGVKKSVLLPLQELVLSNSATCGIPYFTGVSGCIHDGWLYFKELRRVSKYFLYCCLFAKQQEILMGIGEGATQKNLNTDYVGRQLVLLPKEQGMLANFTEAVELLFDQIFTLAQVNISLSKARDLLLPRLMNGETKV